MAAFSKKLVEETILCFKEENNVVLTEEEAIGALKGLAGLYLAFSN